MQLFGPWLQKPAVQILLTMAYVSVGIFVCYRIGLSERQNPVPNMFGLEIAAADLNWGDLWENPSVTRTIDIRNANDQPIEILDFRSTCACLDVEPRRLVLEPKEMKSIKITMNMKAVGTSSDQRNWFYFETWFNPYVKDRGFPSMPWKIRARVHVPFLLSGGDVFDLGHMTDETLKNQTWPLHTHPEVHELATTSSTSGVGVRVTNDLQQLIITPTEQLPLGRFEADLIIKARAGRESNWLEKKYKIIGKRLGPIQAMPENLLLGMVKKTERKPQIVHLMSATPFTMQVNGNTDKALALKVIQDHKQEKELQIALVEWKEGYANHELMIDCKMVETGREYRLPIRICYYGAKD